MIDWLLCVFLTLAGGALVAIGVSAMLERYFPNRFCGLSWTVAETCVALIVILFGLTFAVVGWRFLQ